MVHSPGVYQSKSVLQVITGGQEVILPSGVKYTDLKVGGGTPVQKGYLVILDFRYTSLG